MRGPFARKRGSLDVALTEPEADLLRSVARQMAEILAAPEREAFTTRLFPPAYPDDPEAQTEFSRLMHGDLAEQKRSSVATMIGTLDRGEVRRGAWRVSLSGEEAEDWLAVLNDARLTLGTKLGVTEDDHEREIPPEDPDALAHEVFRYLGWLEEHLVATLL